jgi:hypothetical protein
MSYKNSTEYCDNQLFVNNFINFSIIFEYLIPIKISPKIVCTEGLTIFGEIFMNIPR